MAKDIDNDVKLMKEFIRKHVGTTYDQATAPSDTPFPDMDMSDWGGDRNARNMRNNTPWRQMESAMQDYREYVQRQVTNLCRWHRWIVP